MTEITQRPDHISFSGRILFLTEDTSLIRKQLEAEGDAAAALETELFGRLLNDDLPLMSNISTDEITPGWVCFYYDETLGEYVYVGMREGAVQKDEIKKGGFARAQKTGQHGDRNRTPARRHVPINCASHRC